MIRSGRWKLWVYPDQEKLPPALFDLDSDPFEMNDLGQDPAVAKVREELLAKVFANWDFQEVHVQGHQAANDWSTLSKWAKRVLPDNPDALEIPPPSLEADVELL